MSPVLETVGYRAPLAIQATDAATGRLVGDGLRVTAWPDGDRGDARTARPSPFSALFGFATLPGLRSQEYALTAGDSLPTWPAAGQRPFIVTVIDSLGRYLPEVLVVAAPVTAPLAVTLYSTSSRPKLPGWATVSGELAVAGSGAPAGWAVVELDDGATVHRGITDGAGRFRHYLPYPEVLPALAGTPPVGNGIGNVSWPLTCTVKYQPSTLRWPDQPAPAGPPSIDSIHGQAPAMVHDGGADHASVVVTLRFGQPAVATLTVVAA